MAPCPLPFFTCSLWAAAILLLVLSLLQHNNNVHICPVRGQVTNKAWHGVPLQQPVCLHENIGRCEARKGMHTAAHILQHSHGLAAASSEAWKGKRPHGGLQAGHTRPRPSIPPMSLTGEEGTSGRRTRLSMHVHFPSPSPSLKGGRGCRRASQLPACNLHPHTALRSRTGPPLCLPPRPYLSTLRAFPACSGGTGAPSSVRPVRDG